MLEEKDTHARVSVLDEKMKVANKRIDDLEEKTGNMPKLEVMMDLVIETNKEQTKTLNSINSNLTKLNQGYDNLNKGYGELNERIGTLETDISSSSDDNKIDLNKLRKDVITKVIPSVIGGIVLTWLLIQFGLR